jgi:hypothetical protein
MCISRRSFLGCGAGGFLAFAMRHQAGDLFAQEAVKAKACIVLWMRGGPSQLDTFDPKGGATGGGVKSLATVAKEIAIADSLPKTAGVMNHLSIIRSMTSKEGEHQRATTLLHTGRPFVEGVGHPSAGAIVSKESSDKAVTVPRYVTIGGEAFGPAFLGEEHGPFTLEDPERALEQLRQLQTKRARFKLAKELGRDFDDSHAGELLDRREGLMLRTAALLDTGFPKALDLAKESEELRNAYGRNGFGQGCLLARRLVEAGSRFVEVDLGGWDTHQNNAQGVRTLCSTLDPALAALVADLRDRRLLESTIVLWMGEFGRTPVINAENGRDHFPRAFSVAIGGGGIPGGRVIGDTGRAGLEIAKDPVTVPDLFATIFERFGFDTAKKYRDLQGAVVKMTESGVPVKGLR